MAIGEVLVLRGEGSVDVQVGGAGNAWQFLSACAYMSGPTVPRGGTEIRWCQDPDTANGFIISSKFKTAPDQISFDLMTKLGKIDRLEDLGCPFTLRARYAKCGTREDPHNYDPIMLNYCDTELTEHSYEDLVIADPANQDEIVVTAPATASYEYRIKQLSAARTGSLAGMGDQPINDIEYCDEVSCGGYCGSRSDGCTNIWAVTDVDTTPYAAPNLIRGVKNLDTDAITWTNVPILGFNNPIEGIECAGDRLIVSSNGDSAIAYNDNDGDQDEWNMVAITNAPSANHNALFARTAQEIWLASNSGYVYKSTDGGATWTAVHEATWTSENLNAVWAYDAQLCYVVGDNGVILKTEDGGETWSDMTETDTTGANLLCVVVPPDRSAEVYIGTNDGQIFRSTNEGATFSAYTLDGSGVGTIDDIAFCGPCAGDVMFILHNDAGPRGRILRDLSGGNGGQDVEVVMNYTDLVAAGVDINALACCNPNEAITGGELYGGYPFVVKAG